MPGVCAQAMLLACMQALKPSVGVRRRFTAKDIERASNSTGIYFNEVTCHVLAGA